MLLSKLTLPNNFKKNNTPFKGYAASPLKNLYLQADEYTGNIEVAKQLQKIGQEENFQVFLQLKNSLYSNFSNILVVNKKIFNHLITRWGQDNKTFLNDNTLLTPSVFRPHESEIPEELAAQLNIKTKPGKSFLEGGNFFIGKKTDGTQYAIVGKDSLIYTAKMMAWKTSGIQMHSTEDLYTHENNPMLNDFYQNNKSGYIDNAKKLISEDLNIPNENIYYISQPDYHIDLKLIPIKYPYVIVNSYDILLDEVDKLSNTSEKAKQTISELKKLVPEIKQNRVKNGLLDDKNLIEELKTFGFIPIEVPGIVFSSKANYINSIIHQRPNGDLVYIAADYDTKEKYDIDFETIFKNYLNENVPFIKRVEFISVKGGGKKGNFINEGLVAEGGLHCMVAEHPDFNSWKN